jgi:hypothetical protein
VLIHIEASGLSRVYCARHGATNDSKASAGAHVIVSQEDRALDNAKPLAADAVAVQLDPVAGVIDDGHFGLASLACKREAPCAYRFAEVELAVNAVEPGLLEHATDQGGIINRVRKPRRALVGRITNNERDATLRVRRTAGYPDDK